MLQLRRTALVDDAFAQLAAADPGDYKKPLTVNQDEVVTSGANNNQQ